MKNKEIIQVLKSISNEDNITLSQEKQIEEIIRQISLNNKIENGKQILFMILKILTKFEDFPETFN